MQRPLVLLIAARRAERHVRLAVAQRERGRQRGARPLARCETGGVALVQPEHLGARGQAEAELRDHRRALQPAARRRRRDHVAVAIDHVDMAGVAASGQRGGSSPARGRLADAAMSAGVRDVLPRSSARAGAPRRRSRRSAPAAARARQCRRSGGAAGRCTRRSAASSAARRPRPDRRRTPRGRRTPAWRIRPRCARTPGRWPRARRGRSLSAARAAAGPPAPGSMGRACTRCSRDSRRRSAPRPWPASAPDRPPVSKPRCRRPVTSRTALPRQKRSIASATKPWYQARRAASICASRSPPALSASSRIRS